MSIFVIIFITVSFVAFTGHGLEAAGRRNILGLPKS